MINPGQRNCKTHIYQLSGLTKKKKSLPSDYVGRMGLMQGKAEAIALCLSRKYRLFFTDDSGARDVSELYAIEVHGTAGIVARAHSLGLLSYEETKQVMHDSRTKEVVCT